MSCRYVIKGHHPPIALLCRLRRLLSTEAKAKVDNSLGDLHNSSHHMKAEFIFWGSIPPSTPSLELLFQLKHLQNSTLHLWQTSMSLQWTTDTWATRTGTSSGYLWKGPKYNQNQNHTLPHPSDVAVYMGKVLLIIMCTYWRVGSVATC